MVNEGKRKEKKMTYKSMELEKKDIDTLIEWGYEKSDIPQIQEAIDVSTYDLHEAKEPYRTVETLTAAEAYKKVGREQFLSGIGRSAFHRSSSRECLRSKKYNVGFDSSALFE